MDIIVSLRRREARIRGGITRIFIENQILCLTGTEDKTRDLPFLLSRLALHGVEPRRRRLPNNNSVKQPPLAAKEGEMFFFFLLTAIVAAAMGAAIRFDIPHGARQSWVTWVILGIVLLVGFFLGWLGLFWEPTKALAAIVGSALCGVISGEIIPAVGQGIAQLLRRTLPFVAGGAALVGTYRYCPGLLNQILVLGVVCLGLWIMVRPLFHSGRRRR